MSARTTCSSLIASTGISAAESEDVKIGDTVAIFAQGPIGLCATAGAKLKGAGGRERAHVQVDGTGAARGGWICVRC